jgi:hypothetical protein
MWYTKTVKNGTESTVNRGHQWSPEVFVPDGRMNKSHSTYSFCTELYYERDHVPQCIGHFQYNFTVLAELRTGGSRPLFTQNRHYQYRILKNLWSHIVLNFKFITNLNNQFKSKNMAYQAVAMPIFST